MPVPKATNNLLNKNIDLGQQWFDFSKKQWRATKEDLADLSSRIDAWSSNANKLTADQLNLVKGLTSKTLGLADDFTRSQTAVADWQLDQAKADRARYDTTFRPLEDQFVEDARTYDSEARLDEAAAKAKAGVVSAAEDARATAQRRASALGIRPDSGRAAGIERGADLATALASTTAQNTARDAVRDKALSLRGTAIGLGQVLPGRAASEAGMAVTAQNSALANQLSATNSAITNTGNATGAALDAGAAGIDMAKGLVDTRLGATGLVQNGYSSLMNANSDKASVVAGVAKNDADAQAQETAGIWNAIGTGAGLLLGGTKPWILSDEDLKEDKEPIPEGEALEAVENMPVETWKYKDGVEDGGEHVGTYAQDFEEQTGRGDGSAIPVQDAIGVTMKAVQDLSAKVDRIAAAVGISDPRKAPKRASGLTMKKAA